MSESMVARIARYFFGASTRDDGVYGISGTGSTTFTDVVTSNSRDSFPEILRTGSMMTLASDLLEDVPTRLGPYRILERIGEGGMGCVYLAEQDPPLVRLVAVKLARNAVPGNRALARFESERQTLAVMNHPNIARVFDAGSAPDARPYFVMEHVAGESITAFCDAQRLGIMRRLELFVRVCDGVQHAHVNAVIHRDLKPSNILVTTEAGLPTPKIIDFGVAKALDGGPGRAEGLTQFGQIVGTPEYMSPEQAALDGRPVDTRTDVYSLGVVLYELLVGERPFERDAGSDASFVDLCRRIREEDPERPSIRTVRKADVEAAGRRGSVPQALARFLRRDLDAIVIKALAKDPAGRYATPSDMAADVDRFLQHRPISARAPGPIDRLRKVFRRHRRVTLVIGALSATLVGFAIVGTVQALRAQRASARAEMEARISNQARDLLSIIINPPPGGFDTGESPVPIDDMSPRKTLISTISERFADQPELQSQLLLAARKYSALHRSVRDFDLLSAARDRIASLRGPDSPEALAASESLARTYMETFQCREAEALLLDVLERRRRVVGSDHPDVWRTTSLLGEAYTLWRRMDRAATVFETAIEGLERRLGPDDRDVLSTKVSLSQAYLHLGRYTDTVALLEPALERVRRVFGDRDYQTQAAFYNLARARANAGDVEGALRYLRASVDRGLVYPLSMSRDAKLLPLHGDPRFDALERAARLNNREGWSLACFEAQTRIREGRLADAERLARDLISAMKRVDGYGAGGRAVEPRLVLAKCWILRGRFDDAERFLLPTLAAAQAAKQPSQEFRTLDLLVQCDIGRGRRESAFARIAAAAALDHPLYGSVEKYYHEAQSEALRGRDDEALRSLARASEMGLDDSERLERDLAFKRLRSRAEFAAIVKAAHRRAL